VKKSSLVIGNNRKDAMHLSGHTPNKTTLGGDAMMRYAKQNRKKREYKDFLTGQPETVIVRFIESSKSELFRETPNADHTLMAKTFIFGEYHPDIIEIYIDNIANYVLRDYKFLGKDYKRSAHLFTLMYGLIHEILHEFEGVTPGLKLKFEGEAKV